MRYEWYALHVWPSIELYVDCVDVRIVGSASGQLPSPQVTIPGHLPLDGGSSTSPKYRNEYDSSIAFFFTGPLLATLSGGSTPIRSSTASVIRSSTASLRSSSTGSSSPVRSSSSTAGSTPSLPVIRSSSSTASSRPTASSTGSSGDRSIIITQIYRISFTRYQSDSTNYRAAFINTLAYSSRPKLDVASLKILSVVAVDASRVKVVFSYTPSELPSASEVEEAIAAGRADNSTETMEVESDLPPSVLLAQGYTGSTGDIGETSTSGDVTSASTGQTLVGSASTHSPLLFVTALVTSTLALWMGHVL